MRAQGIRREQELPSEAKGGAHHSQCGAVASPGSCPAMVTILLARLSTGLLRQAASLSRGQPTPFVPAGRLFGAVTPQWHASVSNEDEGEPLARPYRLHPTPRSRGRATFAHSWRARREACGRAASCPSHRGSDAQPCHQQALVILFGARPSYFRRPGRSCSALVVVVQPPSTAKTSTRPLSGALALMALKGNVGRAGYFTDPRETAGSGRLMRPFDS